MTYKRKEIINLKENIKMKKKEEQKLHDYFWEFHNEAVKGGATSGLLDLNGKIYHILHIRQSRETYMFRAKDMVKRT